MSGDRNGDMNGDMNGDVHGTGRHRPDRHDPIDLSARALGLLDETQARAVDEHLAGCASCRREWEELRAMTDLLDELPPEAFLEGEPANDMVLQRTLRQVRTESGTRRRRRRLLVAAAAVVVVAAALGGGVAVGRAMAPPVTSTLATPGAVTLTGTGPTGAAMQATVTPAADWVRLTATVSGVPKGERCKVYVIARNGTREVAGSWVVSERAEARGVTLDGSAAIALGDVAAVSVENDAGEEYVHLDR
jgi:anti-sigma factor RsiW